MVLQCFAGMNHILVNYSFYYWPTSLRLSSLFAITDNATLKICLCFTYSGFQLTCKSGPRVMHRTEPDLMLPLFSQGLSKISAYKEITALDFFFENMSFLLVFDTI